jgi:N-acetylmuramoyl-L-alanine amidase
MSKTRRAKQGEHLSTIAAEEGFADFHVIFDHPNNARLGELKRDPHVLFPGDEVFVPDRENRNEPRLTDATHRFCPRSAPTAPAS